MIEVLAGRLKWERIGDGVRIEFPRQFNRRNPAWDKVPGFVWLWIIVDWLSYSLTSGSNNSGMRPAVDVASVVVVFVLVFLLFWRLMETESLVLERDKLRIQSHSFGMAVRQKTFLTRNLHNLRFGRTVNLHFNKKVRSDEIQIDEDYKTIVLARGITNEEAGALIECMLSVYAFPKYLPSESECSTQGPNSHALTFPR